MLWTFRSWIVLQLYRRGAYPVAWLRTGRPRLIYSWRWICHISSLSASVLRQVQCKDGFKVWSRVALCTATWMLQFWDWWVLYHERKCQGVFWWLEVSVGVLNARDILFDPPLPLPMQDALNSMSPCCNAFLKSLKLSLCYPCEGQVRAWKTCITLCVACVLLYFFLSLILELLCLLKTQRTMCNYTKTFVKLESALWVARYAHHWRSVKFAR